MRNFFSKITLGTALIVISTSSYAADGGCKISNLKLDCGSSSALSKAQAFASSETAAALTNPELVADQFNRPIDMEVFRKSFEKQWRGVNKVAQKQQRNLRRKRITNDEFEAWKATYNSARSNYDLAIEFYRGLVWLGKTGKPAPNDG